MNRLHATVSAAAIVLGIIAGVAGMALLNPAPINTTTATYPASLGPRTTVPPVPVILSPTVAPAGSIVRDGQFEFRVAKVERLKTVGDPSTNWLLQTTAQGEYIVVTMQVTNIGNAPGTYFGTIQKLIGSDRRQFAADTSADMYVNNEIGIVATINPGNWIWGRAAFDVPTGTPLGGMKLELHDSFLSDGASVQIGGTQ